MNLQDAGCGIANGLIEIAPSGGTPEYDILWSNGELGGRIVGFLGDHL